MSYGTGRKGGAVRCQDHRQHGIEDSTRCAPEQQSHHLLNLQPAMAQAPSRWLRVTSLWLVLEDYEVRAMSRPRQVLELPALGSARSALAPPIASRHRSWREISEQGDIMAKRALLGELVRRAAQVIAQEKLAT